MTAFFSTVSRRSAADAFRQVSEDMDIYGAAMKIAGDVYLGVKDKGSTVESSIWDHVQAVETRIVQHFGSMENPAMLRMCRAAAVLHELPELKHVGEDGTKQRKFTPDQWVKLLQDHKMPDFFIDTIDALAIREGEPYLDYIRRVSRDRVATVVKLYGDLQENRSRSRVPLSHKETSQQFKDKKRYLYEMAELYLKARLRGDAGDISVAEYIMQAWSVPAGLKEPRVLEAYSSPGTDVPHARFTLPGADGLRFMCRVASGLSAWTPGRVAL